MTKYGDNARKQSHAAYDQYVREPQPPVSRWRHTGTNAAKNVVVETAAAGPPLHCRCTAWDAQHRGAAPYGDDDPHHGTPVSSAPAHSTIWGAAPARPY
ncbi:MAG: hypothetical protein M3O26_15805 [Pseudomonadota bacterium]|nr:hypothetical protein [Pseudomonadota bacterium]